MIILKQEVAAGPCSAVLNSDAMQVCQIQARDAKRSKMPKLLRKFSSRKKDRCCTCLVKSRPMLANSHDVAPPCLLVPRPMLYNSLDFAPPDACTFPLHCSSYTCCCHLMCCSQLLTPGLLCKVCLQCVCQ